MSKEIDLKTAYRAMFHFLESYFERTGRPDAIGDLLGAMSLETFLADDSADPAMLEDWYEAVENVLNSANNKPAT